MPEARRPMNLSAEQYRGLSLLAEAGPGGVTEAVMISQGLTVTTLIDLVRAGYAWVTRRPCVPSGARSRLRASRSRKPAGGRSRIEERKGGAGGCAVLRAMLQDL